MQHNISTIFKNPAIPEVNRAFSTDSNWAASADAKRINSRSPVDGKKIPAVQLPGEESLQEDSLPH